MKNVIELDFNSMPYTVFKEEWEKVCPENRKIIKRYDNENKRNNLSENSRSNNIQFLISIVKIIKKSLNKITGKDLVKYIDALDVSIGTKTIYVVNLRKFFKWMYQDENPKVLKDIKPVKTKPNKLKFSDLLNETDIQKLIDSRPDPQHKALIAVLYDSACRVGELIGLKRGDVVCENGLWTISVNGKTGVRNIPLDLSTCFLEPWFNRYHPTRDNAKAPLFISMCGRNIYKNIELRELSKSGVWVILDQAKRASGLAKAVHPHLLRHSRLTWLADRGMPENMMRLYAGWTPGSDMPATYLHTNPISVANKIREIQGGEQAPKPEPSKLLPKECPRCKTMNEVTSEYCHKCWLPMNVKVSMAETLLIDLFRSSIYKEESQIAKDEGRFLDIDHLAGKLQEWKQDSANPKRKQVEERALNFLCGE